MGLSGFRVARGSRVTSYARLETPAGAVVGAISRRTQSGQTGERDCRSDCVVLRPCCNRECCQIELTVLCGRERGRERERAQEKERERD